MENDEKKEKPAKVPGALKKPVKEKTFNKRFVKYIEHQKDRQFFISCFDKQQDVYTVRANLKKDEAKKLKELFKWVKKNRKSALKIIPLAFAGIVIAAIVIFFTVFANPLLESAAETGLETIFEAKSEINNLRLSLIDFEISMRRIAVANRDKPMENIFEMGTTKIKLKPAAILRGKIYIEEVRADSIQFGTARKTSGTLRGYPPRTKEEKEKAEGPPLIDLKNFDAMALLEQEFNKLSSPKIYDEAINVYNETAAKWKNQVEAAKAKTEELKTASAPLINLNVNNMRDLDTIRKTVQDVTIMINTVQSAVDETTNMVKGIETDVNNAIALERNARNSIINDINHLKSYIDPGSGAAFAALEPFIRDVLSDTAEKYMDYGLRALEILEMLKAQAAVKPKDEKPKKTAFKGRDVIYPLKSYPKFYLGILASDFTIDTWKWKFDMRNISSNPDITGGPVTLELGVDETGASLARQVGFKGSADFTSAPREKFNALVSGGGFPFLLGNELSKAGISGFSGETAFSVNMTGHFDGGVSMGGDVKISKPRLLDPKGTLAEAAATAVNKAGRVDLGIQYIHHIDSKDEFKINTNIASLLAEALKAAVQAYAQKAMDELEKALRAKIDQYIDGRFVSKEEVDLLLKTARGDKAAVDQLKTSLTNKKNEFENKIKAAANEALDQAKTEATKQAEQAAKDLMQGQTPSLQIPSLPSGGGLKIPGR